jgi:DNA-binding response OmpR family regulator
MGGIPIILMVDDDVEIAAIIKLKLESEGFLAETVNSPEAGLERAKELIPDLILLDVNMPGMNGTEYLIELKGMSNMKDVKVIFFTSLLNPWPATENREGMAKALGAVDFMDKGTDLNEVVKRIRNAIRSDYAEEYK